MVRVTTFSGSGAWTQRGACSQPENIELLPLFFAKTAFERRPARNLCLTECPVRKTCLTWALEKKQIWGVWGGCDEGELRRALWVDSKGNTLERCRYPHCPMCKSRPNRLFVGSACTMDGRMKSWVQCAQCDFSWAAPTSVQAVKSYWRNRRKIEHERRRLTAHAPQGRILRSVPISAAAYASSSYQSAEDDGPVALVASALPCPD